MGGWGDAYCLLMLSYLPPPPSFPILYEKGRQLVHPSPHLQLVSDSKIRPFLVSLPLVSCGHRWANSPLNAKVLVV